MSYRCEITKRVSAPNVKLNKVPVLFRTKTYTKIVKDEDTKKVQEVFANVGQEVVRELSLSQDGVEIWNGWNALQRAEWLKLNP